MRKILLTLASLSMVLVVVVVVAADDAPKSSGSFLGSAHGYVGTVTVKVALSRGKIVSVKIVKHRENRARSSLKVIPKRIVQKQSTEVDVVSRATITSRAVMRAAHAAIDSATNEPAQGIADGVYYGTAKGYVGPIKVGVKVKKERFALVKVITHRENRARTSVKDIPERMMHNQSVEVDAVTRATVTSKAITRAVRDALDKAREKAGD